ncbi:MAG: hypothetical protein N2557_00300 [Hydrogenophilus sp.]|nr:hypothetical protein [Hydrogenophilus sp.]
MSARFVAGRRWFLAAAAAAMVSGAAAGPPRPQVYPERGPCLAEAEQMRREHHVLLKHQRRESVREGVRDAKVDFNRCVACHASPVTQSVAAASSDFCVGCHAYAAVRVDCFNCHQPSAAALMAQGRGGAR